jgi:hypothetical protein
MEVDEIGKTIFEKSNEIRDAISKVSWDHYKKI